MKRLVAETDDSFELELLRSARSDSAPEGGAARTAAALSVAVGVLAASALPASAASAVVASTPMTAPATAANAAGAAKLSIASQASALAIWKWVGVGVLVGIGTSETVHAIRATVGNNRTTAEHAGTMETSATALSQVAAPMASSGSNANEAVGPAFSASSFPASSFPVTKSYARPAIAMVPREASSALAMEVDLIDRANRALVSGKPDLAITLLDRYERELATRSMAPDAEVIRMEAERARGNDTMATQLAERFLRLRANDPHVDRVRRLLSRTPHP